MDVLGVEVRVDDEAAVKNKVEVDGVVFEVQVTVLGDDPWTNSGISSRNSDSRA